MFRSTLPQGAPDLMRVSEFRRYLDELDRVQGTDAANSRLTSLSPSLLQDLQRFEQHGQQSELLEVLAAGIRHTQPLAIHLQWGEQVVTLTMFPAQKLAHAPVPMNKLLSGRLSEFQVLQVEQATLRAPGDRESTLVGNPALYAPLAPLLWAMAMRGSREALLPEIAGQAAYRVAPGVSFDGLDLPAVLARCITRLRRQTCNLREICEWPGIDRGRAQRLLNAVYLQAGLIVSRTHPAATNEGWVGYR
ncbi:MAG: hypothetical protein HY855_01960 [Burkholderiales bacterium]|nr:hypothetical protein [Burkholderiales bacterium]